MSTWSVDGDWNATSILTGLPPDIVVPDFSQIVANDDASTPLKLRFENGAKTAHVVQLCDVQTITYVPEPSVAHGMLLGTLGVTALARRRIRRL